MWHFSRDWLLSAVAALGITLLVTLSIIFWADANCSGASRVALKHAWFAQYKDVRSLGCTEIWFNRNQTFLGNIAGGALALVAAFLAGFFALRAAENAAAPVREQLDEARRQSAINAYLSYRDELSSLETETSKVQEIQAAYRAYVKSFAEAIAVEAAEATHEIKILDGIETELFRRLREYGSICRERPTSDEGEALRTDFISAFDQCLYATHLANKASKRVFTLAGGKMYSPEAKNIFADASAVIGKVSISTAETGGRVEKLNISRRKFLREAMLRAQSSYT